MADEYGAAGSQTDDQSGDHIGDLRSGGDSGQTGGGIGGQAAHGHGVHRAIQLLQKGGGEEGEGKAEQGGPDPSMDQFIRFLTHKAS